MKSVDLNSNWTVCIGEDKFSCDLPYDATAHAARDYSCAFGAANGYIPAERAVFCRDLPQCSERAEIRLDGVCGYGTLYINDTVALRLTGYAPVCVPCDLSGAHNRIKLDLFNAPELGDKYIGLGVAGGVSLNLYEKAGGFCVSDIFVKTEAVGDRVYADVYVSVCNDLDSPAKYTLDCTVLNARGKRAGKKSRKLHLRAHQQKTYVSRVRIASPYEWSDCDPYMYSVNVTLTADGGESSVCSTRFGVVRRMLNKARGLYINGRKTLLMGAYLSHADSALGGVSLYCNEKRRLLALKNLGYNAVHYVGCPSDAALDACDDTGMYAFVDLFDSLIENKNQFGLTGGVLDVTESVKSLRNHPSVTVYGIADDVPECYGRNDGHALIASLCDDVRALDDSRFLTVSAHEFVPTRFELMGAGCKKFDYPTDAEAINAGREKSIFSSLTRGAFDSVDICGYNYLYPLYDSERTKPILGARTSSSKAFDSIDATEKNDRVIGDFCDCGMDYPGGGGFGEICSSVGDLDCIGNPKPQAVYKQILLGARGIAYIVVRDPDTDEPMHLWNWPRNLGQKVKVDVYTSGDVVALYLDNRIVGRKLAGKVNKHIASFEIDYYPGTLQAVAYFKGVECARSTLVSAGSPKSVRLSAFEKNLYLSRGDYGFVYIEVCDGEGNLAPYAMRTLSATVTGGELVALINADPFLRKSDPDSCPAYGGKALAVIKPDPAEAKTVVKITGEGLLCSRISFKIKN